MKKYLFKPIGYMPHVCPSCQEVKAFSTHRVIVEKRNWPMKRVRMPYCFLIQCDECGYRTLYDRSVLEDSVEQKAFEEDAYAALVKQHGEDHYFVRIANAYRNIQSGLADEDTSWAILIFAMEGAHFELRAPRDGQWIRTTTLNRVSKTLIGFLCILFVGSFLYIPLSSAMDLPDDEVYAVVVMLLMLFAVLTWSALSMVAFFRESRSKVREVRDQAALLKRFAYLLRGVEVDGRMLESAFEKGRDRGITTASLDPFKVLEACTKAYEQENPAMSDWSSV